MKFTLPNLGNFLPMGGVKGKHTEVPPELDPKPPLPLPDDTPEWARVQLEHQYDENRSHKHVTIDDAARQRRLFILGYFLCLLVVLVQSWYIMSLPKEPETEFVTLVVNERTGIWYRSPDTSGTLLTTDTATRRFFIREFVHNMEEYHDLTLERNLQQVSYYATTKIYDARDAELQELYNAHQTSLEVTITELTVLLDDETEKIPLTKRKPGDTYTADVYVKVEYREGRTRVFERNYRGALRYTHILSSDLRLDEATAVERDRHNPTHMVVLSYAMREVVPKSLMDETQQKE